MSNASWWKNMKKYDLSEDFYPKQKNATMRSCPAVNDAINFGYMIYFPIDVFIDATDPESIRWELPSNLDLSIFDDNDQSTFIHWHDYKQMPEYPNDGYYHKHALKMNSLWGIKTDPGHSIWITTPIFRPDLPFKIIDAVIDTDSYPTIFPYAFFVKSGFRGIIKAETPFLQVIPFKREEYSHTFVDKNIEDLYKIRHSTMGRFIGAYKKIHWSRKKFL